MCLAASKEFAELQEEREIKMCFSILLSRVDMVLKTTYRKRHGKH